MSFYDVLVIFIISFVSFYIVSGRLYILIGRDFFKYFFCVFGVAILFYLLRFGFSVSLLGLAFSAFIFFVSVLSFFYERRNEK